MKPVGKAVICVMILALSLIGCATVPPAVPDIEALKAEKDAKARETGYAQFSLTFSPPFLLKPTGYLQGPSNLLYLPGSAMPLFVKADKPSQNLFEEYRGEAFTEFAISLPSVAVAICYVGILPIYLITGNYNGFDQPWMIPYHAVGIAGGAGLITSLVFRIMADDSFHKSVDSYNAYLAGELGVQPTKK